MTRMAKISLTETIKGLGLKEYEARVYVTALALGPTTVLNIARKTGIHRTTVYAVMDALKLRGLMHEEAYGFKTKYVADSPEKLELALERKRGELHEALPQLMALYNVGGKESSFKIYEGLEAVKSVYTNILKDLRPHDEYCAVTNHDLWVDLDPEFFLSFLEKRAKTRVHNRILLQNTERGLESKKTARNYGETIRILPKDITLTSNLVITPRLIMMHALQQPVLAVALTDKSFIKMQKEFFEVLWAASSEK